MSFRDFHDTWTRNGWGRGVSREETMEILDQSEKDGLVLFSAAMQEPQFVCACCGCCCGIIEMINIVPRPADFVASNFRAMLDPDACKGCGKCAKRCQLNAIVTEEKKAIAIEEKRCIGCGLCIPSCKSGALQLKKKETEFMPPRDMEDLYDEIQAGRKSGLGKATATARAVLGMKSS
jgi:ferredoxin